MLFGSFKSLDERVEEDRNQLIERLNSSDICELIIEMDNNEPFSDNVIKKQKRDKSLGSEDWTSWYAYRISDELNDPNLKLQLIELLNQPEFSRYKKYILRCLCSLCVNTSDYEIFDFLIEQLEQTDDEETITSVLSRLGKLTKPSNLNIDYLKYLLKEGTYQNRIDALRALANSEHSDLEDLLVQELKTADQHTKGMICATLRTTGSEKSLETLNAELKRARGNDLKYFIQSAIEEITQRKNAANGQ